MSTVTDSSTTMREPALLGQTVVLIGGSSGIGLETARRARAEGADVVLTGRDPERLRRAATTVGARGHAAFDATDSARLDAFFRSLPTPVDHIMVTAGRAEAIDPVRPLPPDSSDDEGLSCGGRARYACTREAERPCFGGRGIAALLIVRPVDGNHAPDRIGTPQGGLRPAHDLDPGSKIRIEQLEPRGIARRRVVGANAVDEQQRVVRF